VRERERESESLVGRRVWVPGTCVSPKEGKMLKDRERGGHVGGLALTGHELLGVCVCERERERERERD
jgi:hypothetical protein